MMANFLSKRRMRMVDKECLLTKEDVCKAFQISHSQLNDLMESQGLPFVKKGKGRSAKDLFSAKELNEWLAKHTCVVKVVRIPVSDIN